MGASGSKAVKKFTSLLSTNNNIDDSGLGAGGINDNDYAFSPLVFSRRGSMFIDEDGDVAHEFYEEVPSEKGRHKASMKRITNNLKPQGLVAYQFPKINANLPVILSES